MNEFHSMLKDICNELNIKMDILSRDWIVKLEKDNKIKFITGYKFDLNSHGLGLVIDDKYAMYEVLCSKNFNSIEYNILFRRDNYDDNYSYVLDYFHKHNNKIVLKPNEGTCGSDVTRIFREEDIDDNLKKLLRKNFSISVCPYYDIKNEYRFIMLDNECQLCYGKQKPSIIGDGIHTIKELLLDFNSNFFKDKELEDRVLTKGEIYEYDWRFNLSLGAKSFELDDNIKSKILPIVKNISNSINLGFGSIDIIETIDNNFYVMEINSGVMCKNYMVIGEDGYNKVKNMYKNAIIKMFE